MDSVQDHPDLVFGVFLSFERERGTLDSLVAAEERVAARRDQLKRRAEKERQKDQDVVREDILCQLCATQMNQGRLALLGYATFSVTSVLVADDML